MRKARKIVHGIGIAAREHDVIMTVIPVAQFETLLQEGEKASPKSRAAVRLITDWMKKAQVHADNDEPVGCVGCRTTLVENMIAGFVIMVSKDESRDSFGFSAGVCRNCMSSHSPEELQFKFGKSLAE